MKRDELLAQIKSGTIKDIYLFYGQETYLMRAALEEIKKVLEEQSKIGRARLCLCVFSYKRRIVLHCNQFAR